jgi:hypothetical protein
MELLLSVLTDMQPGRLVETLIALGALWWKVSPHLNKIEARMSGMETALNTMNANMSKGFAEGDKRFDRLETRVETLEQKP